MQCCLHPPILLCPMPLLINKAHEEVYSAIDIIYSLFITFASVPFKRDDIYLIYL